MAVNPELKRGLDPVIHNLAETLFRTKNNYIITADSNTAAALTRNLIASSNLNREHNPPKLHYLNEVPNWIKTKARRLVSNHIDSPSAIISIDCKKITEKNQDGKRTAHHIIRSIVEQFTDLLPHDAPNFDLNEQYSLQDVEKFLTTLKQNAKLDKQTIIINNYEALSKADQIDVASTLLEHLSSRRTLNTILFHEHPIKTDLPTDGGYVVYDSLENQVKLFHTPSEESTLNHETLTPLSSRILSKLFSYIPDLSPQSEVAEPHNWVDSRDLRSFIGDDANKYDGIPAKTAIRFHHPNDKSDPYRSDISLEYFDNIPINSSKPTPFGRLSIDLTHEKLLSNGSLRLDFRRLGDHYVLDLSVYRGSHQQHIQHRMNHLDDNPDTIMELPPYLHALHEQLANDPSSDFLIEGLQQALAKIVN